MSGYRTRLLLITALCSALGAAGGCDSDPEPMDGGLEDSGSDAATPLSCEVPAPVVAGTPETDALANAPARCGQAAHTWLRSEELGSLTSVDNGMRFTAASLGSLAAAQDLVLPRPPDQSVQLRTIRYTTQDRGALVESTALVGVPLGATAGASQDVMLLLHGTTGFSQPCSPSASAEGQLLVALFASFGYLVVAPDYLGLESGAEAFTELHPYLVGQATAIASLDAVRAALRMDSSDRSNTCARPRFVTFGASQGGHATLWVDRLAGYYARELTHLGAVATVPPADLFAQVERGLTELVPVTSNSAAFYATAPAWYGYEGRLDELFAAPLDTQVPMDLRVDCSPDSLDAASSLDEVFQASLLDAASGGTLGDLDPWGCILRENSLPDTSVARLDEDVPGYGVLYVTGSDDDLVHTPIERNAFADLCGAGLPTTYLECEGAGHVPATFYALPEILRFIDARMADTPFVAPTSCDATAAVRCEATPEE
ncbi:MAG: lipase family protein [Sandaracinaceae bacterium]